MCAFERGGRGIDVQRQAKRRVGQGISGTQKGTSEQGRAYVIAWSKRQKDDSLLRSASTISHQPSASMWRLLLGVAGVMSGLDGISMMEGGLVQHGGMGDAPWKHESVA